MTPTFPRFARTLTGSRNHFEDRDHKGRTLCGQYVQYYLSRARAGTRRLCLPCARIFERAASQ